MQPLTPRRGAHVASVASPVSHEKNEIYHMSHKPPCRAAPWTAHR